MSQQADMNFKRIAIAIDYLYKNHRQQPDLELVAEVVGLSPFHFQKMFKDWAGVSPKKFVSFLNIEYAKSLLKSKKLSLLDVAIRTGLSGTSRLHDLFINIEGMTPGEYKNGGRDLNLNYSYSETQFGTILACATVKGVCHLAFIENEEEAFKTMVSRFPNATFVQTHDDFQQNAINAFQMESQELQPVRLHLKGTDFQIKVWQALLNIPRGNLRTYGNIASEIRMPGASRALGSAIVDNPIAYLIPCHRVIQSTGLSGNYMWGPSRKLAMIGWEAARLESDLNLK